MKEQINVFDYSEQIMKALRRGILLNTNGDKFNSMVISWGHFGIIWGEPTFVVYVREHRYTKSQLDKTMEFTLSIPLDKPDPLISKVCGSLSGHHIDKVREAKLTLVDAETNSTPAMAARPEPMAKVKEIVALTFTPMSCAASLSSEPASMA